MILHMVGSDGSRIFRGQVVDGSITASMALMSSIINYTEHEQMHCSQVQQQKTKYRQKKERKNYYFHSRNV